MSFTWQGTYFFNGEAFDEIEHAKALGNGIINFVGDGMDYSNGAVTSGKGINNGVPFMLGRNGEAQGVTANYTGYLVLKTTLNSVNSTTELMESTTIPASTDNIKYFAIYQLENGAITQDLRHIEYIKSFELKNVGGNNFVFVLNGFKSSPFDASALAGNRTLINEIDIGYDDSIHASTPLQDILKDLFVKAQTLTGNDKPFILSFSVRESATYNINLGAKLYDLIEEKYGVTIPPTEIVTFKMDVNTASGITGLLYSNANKCSLWSSKYYFEFEFDYDNWANVVVRDGAGSTSTIGSMRATTDAITYYVHGTNGSDSNDGLSTSTPFRTPQKAIDSLPRYIYHHVQIHCMDSVVEPFIINGFMGTEMIMPTNGVVSSGTTLIRDCVTQIWFINFTFGDVDVQKCQNVVFDNATFNGGSGSGVYVTSASNVLVSNSTINNCSNSAIFSKAGSIVVSDDNTGSGNNTGLEAMSGIIFKQGTQPIGTTAELKSGGGQIW